MSHRPLARPAPITTTREVDVESDVRIYVTYVSPPKVVPTPLSLSSHTPLLVIHGGPDWDHTYLTDPLSVLGSTRQVLFPDLRGCGHSTRGLGPSRLSPDLAVADLLAVLDDFGIAQAHVLGFSFGGWLAQRLALTAPKRVRSLVLASTTLLPVPTRAWETWPVRVDLAAPGLALRHGPQPATSEERAAWVHSIALAEAPLDIWVSNFDDEWATRLESITWAGEWLEAHQLGILPSATLPDAPALLRTLGIPLLILHGDCDMRFPVGLARRAAVQANASLAVIDVTGHMVHVEKPEQWLAAITAFLDPTEPPPPPLVEQVPLDETRAFRHPVPLHAQSEELGHPHRRRH